MREDRSPWSRRHDADAPPIVPAPERHLFPEPEHPPNPRQELLQLVRDANALRQPTEIRACGSGWALSEAAVTQRWVLETHPLNRTLYDVIPGCLSAGALAMLTGQAAPAQPDEHDPASFNFYHVESGVRLYDLYSRLDGQGDSSGPGGEMPTTRAGLDADFPVLRGQWALPTLGGAGGQTLAGAFSTGTHGGDVALPPLADAVEAVHLIAADEHEYWIERGFRQQQDFIPLTDDARLRALYGPELLISRDQALFDAALVSVGRFGIIYSVVLRVVRQFGLRQERTRSNWSALRPRLRDPADTLHRNRFVQVLVNPHQTHDHTCFLTTRAPVPRSAYEGSPPQPGRERRTGLNAGRKPPVEVGGDLLTDACSRQDVGAFARDLEAKLGIALTFAFLFAPPLVPLLTTAIALVAGFTNSTSSLGELMASLINGVSSRGDFRLVAMINDFALRQRQGERPLTDVSYAVMDIADYSDVQCVVAADSLEVVFDASRDHYLDFVDIAFSRLDQLQAGTLVLPDGRTVPGPMTFGGYLSLRFTGRTEALIGMQQWPRTVHIEISGLKGIAGNDFFLRALERDAIGLGGLVHWGQANRTDALDVQGMYPAIELWREQLARVTRNGRFDCFSTPFTRQRGLEVLQPRIASFEPETRRYLCAGEPFFISWDAADNPRATRLEIHGLNPSPQSVPLSGRVGLAVAEGAHAVFMVATRDLGPLHREERTAAVTLVGVGPAGYLQPISGRAVRADVDGTEHWVADVELPDAEWSAMLRPGNMYVLGGTFPSVTVRKEGATDVPLRPGWGIEFLERVPMSGRWRLIGPPVKAVASPPELGILVRVHC